MSSLAAKKIQKAEKNQKAVLGSITFGDLLKQLRKRAGMTQDDLAAATGYSRSLIAALERNLRLPDLESLIQSYLPALGLQDEPRVASQLVELAALARGERVPTSLTLKRERRLVITTETTADPPPLPIPPTRLLGRDQEISHLCKRLLGHHGRLLTLVGPPGVGKTSLALAVTAHLHLHYQDGVRYVPLAAITDPALVAATLVNALKLPDSPAKPPQTLLVEHLRRKEMLLLLDNFEQIIAAAPLLAAMLAECVGLCILVTSRERLHLRAEQRYKVPPLALDAAVALFVQRAQAGNSAFNLTAHNRPILETICERLDCLPLAIELCAAQLELFAPTQLLAQLQAHPLDLLGAGAQDLPPRHRTLRAAIERSYALLNDDEQQRLRSLSVFRGGFDLAAVEMISGEREGASLTLRSLIGKSLVRAETLPTGEQCFLLLETIREFAWEQVREYGEEADLYQRHYALYLHLFRTGDGYLRGAEMTTWMARLELEQDNLRAALQWTLDAACYADTAWLIIAAGYLWAINGHRYEGAKWVGQLLPHRQGFTVELRLATLIEFISSASDLEGYPSPDQYRAEIIELMAVCPYKQLHAGAWYFLAQSNDDRARAVAIARAASEGPRLGAEFCSHTDDDFGVAANQLGYASSFLYQGKVAQATMMVTDSLHRFRKRGNHSFIADCLGVLGGYALLRGDIAEAYSHLQEVMTIGKTYNLPVAEWQSLLGLVMLYGGNRPEARRLIEESLSRCLEVKNTFFLARAYMCLAETSPWEGDLNQAAEWLAQSLAYHSTSWRITTTDLQLLFIAGRLATAQGQYQRAAMFWGIADTAHRQIHHIYAGPMMPLVNTALATVRSALELPVFDAAFAAGQQMSVDEAFAIICQRTTGKSNGKATV